MRNLVGIYYSLFRAIEIAKAGGHAVTVCFDEGYTSGKDDYNSIKEFCSGWFSNFTGSGGMNVEMLKPSDYCTHSRSETLEDIKKRIDKAGRLAMVEPKLIDSTSEHLFRVAADKLNLSIAQQDRAILWASTIARLDGSNKIRTEHIAEAIQYSYNYALLNNCVIPENDEIVFGGMISINYGHIDDDVIHSAIQFLQSKLSK